MMDQVQTDWQELVYRGVESDELDYKAAQNWDDLPKNGKAKFVRHLLAFANTRGGYLVVGVGEDRSGYPALRTGLTPEQSASFDPSKVGAFVNQHVEPPIDFTIERPVIRGKRYAIFAVRPFRELPHVCSGGVDGELQTGVFYIRTPDASSRPARRAIEMSDIIRRALRNQREMLGRMLRGILYESKSGDAPVSTDFNDQVASALQYFRSRRPEQPGSVLLSIVIEPENKTAFEDDELKTAVTGAGLPRPGGRFFTPSLMRSMRRVNLGLRCLEKDSPVMWQLFKTGEFLFFADITADSGKTGVEEILKFVAENIAFTGKLYAGLTAPDELLTATVKLSSGEKFKLISGSISLSGTSADKASATICRSTADLASGDVEHAVRICSELAVPFRISSRKNNEAAQFIRAYLSQI